MTGLYLLGGLLTHSCTQNTRCVFKVIPQSNAWYRGPTELVQHFAYRENSHQLKGAARHIIDMVWLYSFASEEEGGFLLVQIISTCRHGALSGGGGGGMPNLLL
jgi:hypothetical protein